MNKINWIKALGLFAGALSITASAISSFTQNETMKEFIKEEVGKTITNVGK